MSSKRPTFKSFVLQEYGTISEFARKTGISINTARAYIRRPGVMQMRIINLISEHTGKDVCEIIELTRA
jgi:hypothetical protein